MTFHFALQSLLRYRLGMEDRAWLNLQAATIVANTARVRLRDVGAMTLDCRNARALSSMAQASAAELRFAGDCEQNLGMIRERLLIELAQCDKRCDEKRALYLLARRERESLESLRDAQFQLWKMDESRREQNSADDLFLLGRAFRQAGTPCPPE